MGSFKKAVKQQLKLRMALMGAPGSGKSYSALQVAKHLAGPGGTIAAIDTEHGSLSKYSDLAEFDVCELTSFHPDNYTNAILEAGAAGYSVLIIDSMSHAWSGKDGLLEEVDKIAKRKNQSSSFQSWKDANPILNRMVQSILSSPCHVIVTMRTKVEWVIEQNERGKSVPRKVGMAPVMKDQISYEFDIVGEMTEENEMIVSKSRCSELAGQVIHKPGKQVAETLRIWLSDGVAVSPTPSAAVTVTLSSSTSPSSSPSLGSEAQPSALDQLRAMKLTELKNAVVKLPFFSSEDWLNKLQQEEGVTKASELTLERIQALTAEAQAGATWFLELPIKPDQIKIIQTIARSLPNFSDEAWAEFKNAVLGVSSIKELNRAEAGDLIGALKAGEVIFAEPEPESGPELQPEPEMEKEFTASDLTDSTLPPEQTIIEYDDFVAAIDTVENYDDLNEWVEVGRLSFEHWINTGQVATSATITRAIDKQMLALIQSDLELPELAPVPLGDFIKRLYAAKRPGDVEAAKQWLLVPARYNQIKKRSGDKLQPWIDTQVELARQRLEF